MDIVYWRNNLDINLIVLPTFGGEQKDLKFILGRNACKKDLRLLYFFLFALLSRVRPASGMTLAINFANCRHWSGVTDWSGHSGWPGAVGSLNKDRPSVNLEMSYKFQDNVLSVVR